MESPLAYYLLSTLGIAMLKLDGMCSTSYFLLSTNHYKLGVTYQLILPVKEYFFLPGGICFLSHGHCQHSHHWDPQMGSKSSTKEDPTHALVWRSGLHCEHSGHICSHLYNTKIKLSRFTACLSTLLIDIFWASWGLAWTSFTDRLSLQNLISLAQHLVPKSREMTGHSWKHQK